ncbi:Helix-turn-helix domain-containing protein [Haloarcula vallismortis]|uniref:ArsR family transcriptional regulator n=2 Tax=Haloarcula vallismortis TaxID=28442 RepID=M0J9G7_HALVA|nr:helix-turn-helix domain-containing protein [Haloarcula vallismortis]EMA05621.1 hypothetical protein C437_12381 [Haloarcula vallismortis ATCC 29715]SDX28868.1 Helix-turn-helix domain-containing protein [Haloarcula vallismortis]
MPQSGSEEASTDDPQLDTERLDQLRIILEETRLRLLQQILASDSGALSVEELGYRNTDIKDQTIDYHLRELADRGIVTKLKTDSPANDLPSTYWAVSDLGIQLLKRLGFYDEIAVLSEADDSLERTARIEEIEAFSGRPSPNWYDSHSS